MAKNEFREIISCGPAVLYRGDIVALAELFSEGGSFTKVNSHYSITFGSITKTADLITDLLADTPMPYTDKFGATIQYMNNYDVVAGIYLTCYHNYIQYQIHSSDSTWYHGKREQLRTFFKNRQPWYALLKPIMPMVWPILLIVFIMMAGLAMGQRNWLRFSMMATACLIFAVIAVQEIRQRWFPFVRIFFRDRKSIEWTPELTIAVLGLVISIVAIIVDIIKI